MVNTRRDRLAAFRATLARYPGVIAENAEIPSMKPDSWIIPCASSIPAIGECVSGDLR